MKHLAAAITLALVSSTTTAQPLTPKLCKEYVQSRIDHIEHRLRAGYSAKEGNYLKRTRSELRNLYQQCEKDPRAAITAEQLYPWRRA